MVVRDLLQQRGAHALDRPTAPWLALLGVLLLAGLAHGTVLGSYGGRPLQMLYSALKVPLLLLVSSALCLPSFFVLNTVLGLRDDWRHTLRALLATQATLALCLASLAPVTLVIYASGSSYELAIILNGVQFALATLISQQVTYRHYRELIRRDRRHLLTLLAWCLSYAFVGIQMGWVLRPFIGRPQLETNFFRQEAWSNAYLEVLDALARLLGSGSP